MAAIPCPHCGNPMYEKLATCPHCGGPVISQALQQDIEMYTEQRFAEVNESHKTWFKISTLIGVAMSIIVIVGTAEGFPWFLKLFYIIAFAYGLSAAFYGFYRFHPINRFGIFLIIPVILVPVFYVAMLAGIFSYYPKALKRFRKKMPLVTEEEFRDMLKNKVLF